MLRKVTHPCVVTFMGPVGVGKSTQIALLENYLESRNVKVRKTFIKSNHIFAFALGRLLILLGARDEVRYSEGYAGIHPRGDLLRKLFSLLILSDALSIVLKFFLAVCIPFRLGFTILIEEGPSMTQYTYRMYFPAVLKTAPRDPPMVKYLLAWIAHNKSATIVLNATDDELQKRRHRRGYRPQESSSYISMQKQWLRQLNQENLLESETASESMFITHKKIRDFVLKIMS